jgi:hypothetical protein
VAKRHFPGLHRLLVLASNAGMDSLDWQKAAKQSADPQRARRYFDELAGTDGAEALRNLHESRDPYWPRCSAGRRC